MKRFLIITGIVFMVAALALAVFVLTFDANRYKGLLIAKLEEAMDKDVMIDILSLSLLDGLGVEAKGVAIKDRNKTWDDFFLKAKSMGLSVEILPLLKKDIQIQRLFIPELSINTGIGPDSPVFRCGFDLRAHILINSMAQDDMLKGLTAKGNMRLENAVLDNMNVLNAALDKLDMLPGLVQKLKDSLPEKYKGLLNQDYTAFKPMYAGFEMKDGRIYFDKLLVESDAFYLVSRGSFGMDQYLQVSADFFIPQDLSDAFSNVVPELSYLKDNKGLITMPLEIKGKVPDISVIPDLNYVIQRLAVSKGLELLDKLFKIREK